MPLPEKLDPDYCEVNIGNFNGMDSAELDQHFYNGFCIFSDGLSFQVQIDKNQLSFTVTELNTVHFGVFTYQLYNYDWVVKTLLSKSRCKDDKIYRVDNDIWSLKNEEIYLNCDDSLDKLFLEGHTFTCLQSVAFVN